MEMAIESPFRLVPQPAPEQSPAGRKHADVTKMISELPDNFLECREGRHRYERKRLDQMSFRRNAEGYDIYEADCTVCKMAYREEKWLIVEDKHGNVERVRFMGATTKYRRQPDGERNPYLLPPGSGYYSPNEVRETRVGAFLKAQGGVKRYGANRVRDAG